MHDLVLTWLHIGDLHVTEPGGPNPRDLAPLPGDNADDGTAEHCRRVRDTIAPLLVSLHILADGHDFTPGRVHAFHGGHW